MNYSKYNLHTHSFYCGHGKGKLSEYVEQAKKNQIDLLGFSEHCPVKENRWRQSRMSYETIDTYIEDINTLKRKENDISNNDSNKESTIKLLSGFECDYFPQYRNYYDELREKCDYLIFGVHYLNLPQASDHPIHHHDLNSKALVVYTNQYIKSIESGIFSIAAHPDLFFLRYYKWDNQTKAISKEIIEASIYYDIPIEINGNGILKDKIKGFNGEYRYPYPVKEFWEMANSYDDVKIITNADAHSPNNLKKSFDMCNDFAKELDIKYRKANIDNIDNIKKVEFV